MLKVLLLDNYDSFTYNLAHDVQAYGKAVLTIARNDEISLEEVAQFDKIILSPGPGLPKDAGIMPALILCYAPIKPILGVCLGHQAIAEAFGGRLKQDETVYHGIATPVTQTCSDLLFKDIPLTFSCGRYHSWMVSTPLPESLEMLAADTHGNCMALRHKTYDIRGVQFHPESIMTEFGKQILGNWLLAPVKVME